MLWHIRSPKLRDIAPGGRAFTQKGNSSEPYPLFQVQSVGFKEGMWFWEADTFGQLNASDHVGLPGEGKIWSKSNSAMASWTIFIDVQAFWGESLIIKNLIRAFQSTPGENEQMSFKKGPCQKEMNHLPTIHTFSGAFGCYFQLGYFLMFIFRSQNLAGFSLTFICFKWVGSTTTKKSNITS